MGPADDRTTTVRTRRRQRDVEFPVDWPSRCPPVPVVLPPAFDPDAWAPLPADPSRTERLDTCKPAAVLQELLQLGNASVAGRQHLGHLAHPASRRTTTLSVTRLREFEEHLVAIRPRCADLKPRPGVLAGERHGTNSEGRVGVTSDNYRWTLRLGVLLLLLLGIFGTRKWRSLAQWKRHGRNNWNALFNYCRHDADADRDLACLEMFDAVRKEGPTPRHPIRDWSSHKLREVCKIDSGLLATIRYAGGFASIDARPYHRPRLVRRERYR
jgi:hypothetical protein